MKKINFLKKEIALPQKSTIDFLLRFSKSMAILKTTHQNFIVSKN